MSRRLRIRKVAALGVAVSLLAACQSTTEAGGEADDSAYPDVGDSPGIRDGVIRIAVNGATDLGDELTGEFYVPIYRGLAEFVEPINADGGVLGHQLELVPLHDNYSYETTTRLGLIRPLCANAVGREPSFAFEADGSTGGVVGLLRQAGCLGPARTINILRSRMMKAVDLEENPDIVAPYALDDVTAARVLVERLDDRGFFDGATRVGVLSASDIYEQTIRDVLIPELADVGVDEPYVLIGNVGPDGTETPAEAASNALRLKTEGVDRLIYFSDDQTGYNTFVALAEQRFTPPVATIGINAPALVDGTGYPPRQFSFVSTQADFSTTGGDEVLASMPPTDASQACVDAHARTGMEILAGGAFNYVMGCDVLALTVAALEASGAEEPSTASFFDGLSRLDSFDSAFGVELDFTHGRAGASQVWDLQGDDECTCLKIAGGPYPVVRE